MAANGEFNEDHKEETNVTAEMILKKNIGVLRILWKKSCLWMFFGILYVSYEFV